MKIFEIRFEKEKEKAWVYALTNIDAIKTYCFVSGSDLVEFDKEDFIFEIPKEQWKDYTVYDDESEELDKKTFEKWVSENEIYGSDIIAITAK